jgi:hypothetical protein
MTMKIKDKKEYDNIIAALKDLPFQKNLDRHQIRRIKKKAENFKLINDILYFKVKDGLHKRVFYETQIDFMKLEVERLHNDNHFGQNRMYSLCKDHFFQFQEMW